MSEIDQQYQYTTNAIKKRFDIETQNKVGVIELLEKLWTYIKEQVSQWSRPNLDDLLENLQNTFLQSYLEISPPRSMKDIVNASYIAAYIQNMEKWYGLAIENSEEMQILINTDKAIKWLCIDSPWMTAAYLTSNISYQEGEHNYFADVKNSIPLIKKTISSYMIDVLDTNPDQPWS